VGLIQWVHHTTSLFALFKSWQQAATERYQAMAAARQEAAAGQAAAPAAAAAAGPLGSTTAATTASSSANPRQQDAAAAAPAAAPRGGAKAPAGQAQAQQVAGLPPLPAMVKAARPAELFYARLVHALQEAGVDVSLPRRAWPVPVGGAGRGRAAGAGGLPQRLPLCCPCAAALLPPPRAAPAGSGAPGRLALPLRGVVRCGAAAERCCAAVALPASGGAAVQWGWSTAAAPPPQVLTKVLQQLVREVPAQLLAREVWSGSGSSAAWWRRTQQHARSSAAASAVGYLLGIGDRHLDNILLDLRCAAWWAGAGRGWGAIRCHQGRRGREARSCSCGIARLGRVVMASSPLWLGPGPSP
jgi:hypothetical protein